MTTTQVLLVGFDYSNGPGNNVLVVGRKEFDGKISVINTFRGKEADELFKKLTERGGVK